MNRANPVFSQVLIFAIVVIVIAGGALAYFFRRETKIHPEMDHDDSTPRTKKVRPVY